MQLFKPVYFSVNCIYLSVFRIELELSQFEFDLIEKWYLACHSESPEPISLYQPNLAHIILWWLEFNFFFKLF